MARNQQPQRGKALDLWVAPPDAGEPLICVATSFTFDATFFETECIGRFLQMDHHPSESESVAYLIEREEKLAAAKVCALVDRRHARDKESLRWDIIGILVPKAIQHSKVSLLVWGNHARVIVGSGNLTEPGYRKNLEVFGTIELSRENGGDRQSVLRVIDFLDKVLDRGVGVEATDTPKGRTREALAAARHHIARWPGSRTKDSPSLVFGLPTRGVLAQVLELWPTGGPPRWATVMSPFFDVTERAAETVASLLDGLARRGERDVKFFVRSEPLPDGRTRLYAPLEMVRRAEERCDVTVYAVTPTQDEELRLLHAKILTLESQNAVLLLVGSSNFTAAGLTAAGGGNFEANLLYRLPTHDMDRVLLALEPSVEEEPFHASSHDVVWDPEPESAEGSEGDVPLPACFRDALFSPGSPAVLAFHLDPDLPSKWHIRAPNGPVLLGSESAGPGTHHIPWEDTSPPFVVEVSWISTSGAHTANWPVNVANPASLPAPDVLRTLSLEELLAILASTHALPQAVLNVLRRRRIVATRSEEVLDPLKRMDSPTFLLRRTKRVAAALDQLRVRLERPALSKDALYWRLNGPIGVMALAEAFAKEARLPGEARFYLAELALTLKRVDPRQTATGGLKVGIIQELLAKTIEEIRTRAQQQPTAPDDKQLQRYVAAAFLEAGRP